MTPDWAYLRRLSGRSDREREINIEAEWIIRGKTATEVEVLHYAMKHASVEKAEVCRSRVKKGEGRESGMERRFMRKRRLLELRPFILLMAFESVPNMNGRRLV